MNLKKRLISVIYYYSETYFFSGTVVNPRKLFTFVKWWLVLLWTVLKKHNNTLQNTLKPLVYI